MTRPALHQALLALALGFGIVIGNSVHAQSAPDNPRIENVRFGFNGVYKLGCWTPLDVEFLGGAKPWTGRVVVTVPDTDGVPTRVVSDANRPVGIQPGQTTTARLFVRVGQTMSPVQVRFISDDGKVRASRRFQANYEASPGMVTGGAPATNRVLLEFGPTIGLGDLVQNSQSGNSSIDDQLATRVTRVEHADDLPTRWYGYESIDTVLLSTSDVELYRPLSSGSARIQALAEWVERGGRLVIFCAASAEELLAGDGPLASLTPGKFEKLEQLTQPQPLATFSGSEQPITADRRLNLSVPSLVDVRGQILASAGRSETTVPLVVRTARGLGEIVFVGLDFDRPPLRDWAGRNSFLRRVLDWQDASKEQTSPETGEADDLTTHLRNSLDKKFSGVEVVPFALVALLVGLYILLIGPGDYFFVKRVLKRTELTWITFPLIVVGVSAAAYVIANQMKGDQLRVNQVEIIDVDVTSNQPQAVGTVWTHFFTPQVSEFDLKLRPSYFGNTELDECEQLVSWLGLPGYALGGMQASGSQTSVFDSGYQFGDRLASLQALPVQVWSTKTITARWSADVEVPIEADLQRSGDELLRGQVANGSEVELADCVLLYGRWAYDLGRMPAGKRVPLNDSLQPRTVKTLLTSATAGDETNTQIADDGTVPFRNVEWDIARLAKVMMFYEAVNGRGYTGQVDRYQNFVDLSHLLKHNDRAILLARCESPGSQWRSGGDALSSDDHSSHGDRRWTYYRFVLNVKREAASSN